MCNQAEPPYEGNAVTTGNLPALPTDFGTGLEDFSSSDALTPRLTIMHKEGLFKDTLTNETFDKVHIIVLGLVKQRVLWNTQVDDGDQPMCKSPNNADGFPNDDAPKDKRFPWDKSGFDKADYPPGPDDQRQLPCAGCKLKEWGTHPNGKSPYCTEQWTMPVYYRGADQEQFVPAIFTLQRSGVKAIRAYLSGFQRQQSPAFVGVAEVGLDLNTRGDVTYSTPKFRRVGDTDQAMWSEYAQQFMEMKDYLTRRPESDDDGAPTEVGANNTNSAPVTVQATEPAPATPPPAAPSNPTPAPAPPAPTPQAAAPTPAPAVAADDDDLPF